MSVLIFAVYFDLFLHLSCFSDSSYCNVNFTDATEPKWKMSFNKTICHCTLLTGFLPEVTSLQPNSQLWSNSPLCRDYHRSNASGGPAGEDSLSSIPRSMKINKLFIHCWFACDVTAVVKNKTFSLRWELNSIFMQILRKKLYCIDHQHGRLCCKPRIVNDNYNLSLKN